MSQIISAGEIEPSKTLLLSYNFFHDVVDITVTALVYFISSHRNVFQDSSSFLTASQFLLVRNFAVTFLNETATINETFQLEPKQTDFSFQLCQMLSLCNDLSNCHKLLNCVNCAVV